MHLTILGASSGIGAGTAILFCKLGAEVAITGRNVENLSRTADECEKNNGKKVNRSQSAILIFRYMY